MALRSTVEPGQVRPSHTVTIDGALARKAAAELFGTAVLVFFGCGVATVSFGFRASGSSIAAGILVTGLTFGLVFIAIVAVIGPISGSHVNPAVTLAAYLNRRLPIVDAVAYWIAQVIGAIVGALLLLWVLHSSPFYIKSRIGLGTNGWGSQSLLHASAGGAFLIEVILTAFFVMVVLSATRKDANVPIAGLVMGLALATANIGGIAVDGASVNPARSLGPAIVRGGVPLTQVWLFLIAPLIGAVLAAGLYLLFHPGAAGEGGGLPGLGRFRSQPTGSQFAAVEGTRSSGAAVPGAGSAPTTGQSPAPESSPQSGPSAQKGATPGGDPEADTGPVNPPGSGGANTLLAAAPVRARALCGSRRSAHFQSTGIASGAGETIAR